MKIYNQIFSKKLIFKKILLIFLIFYQFEKIIFKYLSPRWPSNHSVNIIRVSGPPIHIIVRFPPQTKFRNISDCQHDSSSFLHQRNCISINFWNKILPFHQTGCLLQTLGNRMLSSLNWRSKNWTVPSTAKQSLMVNGTPRKGVSDSNWDSLLFLDWISLSISFASLRANLNRLSTTQLRIRLMQFILSINAWTTSSLVTYTRRAKRIVYILGIKFKEWAYFLSSDFDC